MLPDLHFIQNCSVSPLVGGHPTTTCVPEPPLLGHHPLKCCPLRNMQAEWTLHSPPTLHWLQAPKPLLVPWLCLRAGVPGTPSESLGRSDSVHTKRRVKSKETSPSPVSHTCAAIKYSYTNSFENVTNLQ